MKENKGEVHNPSQEVINNANIKNWDELDKKAKKDYPGFWSSIAEELHWFKKWDKVIDDTDKPFYKWFTGAKTNIVYNCLDTHVKTFRRNKLALIWEGENGESKTFSYFALLRETCKFANILKSLGVNRGDRVTIYMGRTPEIIMAMLACARIGAIHSVVYGGFSVESLAERIEDSNSKVLIVSDGAYQRGKVIPLKQIADEALQRCGTVEHVLVVKRTGQQVNMEQGRDMWLHELMNLPIATMNCALEVMDAEDPLFIL
ncbi:MAG: AMP-binding protein, partial [Melioribacter sp.]|nr:AMP-binding protein [Melioribacter sp.]